VAAPTDLRAPRRPVPRAPRTAREFAGALIALARALLARPLADYYLLVSTTAILLGLGLAMVYSATSVQQYAESGSTLTSIEKQAISAAVGVVVFWLFQRLPVRTYRALARPGLLLAFVLVGALDVLEVLETTERHLRRALQVQRLLAARSQRGRKIPGLLVAAGAEEHRLAVLHYDRDFDLIAAVTGQATEWVVAAGSVD